MREFFYDMVQQEDENKQNIKNCGTNKQQKNYENLSKNKPL